MAVMSDLVRVQFKGHLVDNQVAVNTFYITKVGHGVPSLADLTALSTDLATYFTTTYKALYRTDGMFDTVTCYQVSDPSLPVPVLEVQATVNAAGTRSTAGTGGPDQLCAVLSLKTQLVGRRYRGHQFLPPSTIQADVTGAGFTVAGAYWVAVLAYAAKLQTGCLPTPTWTGSTLSSWTLCVFSTMAAKTLTPPYASGVFSVVATNRSHWLRSRYRGTT